MKPLLLFSSILLFIGCTNKTIEDYNRNECIASNSNSRSLKKSTFVFPNIQWEKLDTHEQKTNLCEIPDSLLNKIPTEELVEICMNYPLLFDAYAFETPLIGLKVVTSRFNGFTELLKRKDNCSYIFKHLKNYQIESMNLDKMSSLDRGEFKLTYTLCEYLLSFDKILSNATNEQLEEIILFANETSEHKEANTQHYALNGLTSSIYLWASVAIKKTNSRSFNPILENFIAKGIIRNHSHMAEIKQICQSYN